MYFMYLDFLSTIHIEEIKWLYNIIGLFINERYFLDINIQLNLHLNWK